MSRCSRRQSGRMLYLGSLEQWNEKSVPLAGGQRGRSVSGHSGGQSSDLRIPGAGVAASGAGVLRLVLSGRGGAGVSRGSRGKAAGGEAEVLEQVRCIRPLGGGATRSFLFRYWAVLIVVPPALLIGRWATCHYLCWIAPLMIFGSRVSQRAGLPSLQVAADPGKCRRCTLCSRTCPMSLDVQEMVLADAMRSGECILRGHCVSVCPSRAVRFAFGRRLRTAGPVSQPSA